VRVKVLDIDRERQRISLGLKQTQSDPWQQVIDTYQQGDVVEGKVTKVVTFGAFVEVVPGVEGLVHISELATHHVENPREIVQQGESVRAKIIEMDAERRRLSLSLKRVEEGEPARPGIGEAAAPDLGLSEEVFAEQPAGVETEEQPEAGAAQAEEADAEPEIADEAPVAEDAAPVVVEDAAPVADETSVEEERPAQEEPLAEGEPVEAEPPAEEEPLAQEEPAAEEEPGAEEEPPAEEAPSAEGDAPAQPGDEQQ
jgi:small subunit ribosomal protein S1